MAKRSPRSSQRARRKIAFIINEFEGRYPTRLTPTALRYCIEKDIDLLIVPGGAIDSNLGYEAQLNVVYDLINSDTVDGIVMATGTLMNYVDEKRFQDFVDHFKPLPIVSISIKMEGIPSVLVDNKYGVVESVNHMIQEHKHRRIAFIRGTEHNQEAEERYNAYLSTLKSNKIPYDPNLVVQGNFTPFSGAKAIIELLDKRKARFDSVVAANDEMALGAMEELNARGVRVPQDFAIIGFDNIEGAQFNPTPLTTVEQPLSEQGRKAFEMMLDILDGKPVPETVYLPTKLIIRYSCGCTSESKLTIETQKGRSKPSAKNKGISASQRQKIISDLMDNLSDSYTDHKSMRRWLDGLVENFSDGYINDEVTKNFIRTFRDILNEQVKKERNLNMWQNILMLLNNSLFPYLTDKASLAHANVLFQKARNLVEDVLKREQGLYVGEISVGFSMINEITQKMISSLSLKNLKDTVANDFPRLGMSSCYICLYLGNYRYQKFGVWKSPEKSELLIAYDKIENIVLQPEKSVFQTVKMLPDGILPNRRYTMVLKPLFFMQEHLGFILFELPERQGIPHQGYETLRIQISSAIKSAMLFETTKKAEEELKKANRKLSESYEKMKELDLAKTNFFANISHETRTPLTLIMGPLESILSGHYGDKIDRNDEMFQSMLDNSNRLLKLINNLLDFSKIEAGRMTIRKSKTNVSEMLTYFLSTVHAAAESREITIDYKDDTPGVVAWIDRDLIEKAVFNLISNALKFTPAGKNVSILLESRNKNFYITVKDSGIGIPKDKLGDIFERFNQLDNTASRRYEGTGIGLAYAKEIVQLHGGSITVKSKEGEGSAFTIILPYGDTGNKSDNDISDQVEDIQEVKQYLLAGMSVRKDKTRETAADDGRKKILVADDNADMRNFLTSLLDKEYIVLEAENGKDALEKAAKEMPDIILSDVMMPEMDGHELTRRIRESAQLKSIPIILLTAKADLTTKLAGLGYGADDYLSKPFNSKELFIRLRNLLKSRELQNELVQKQREIEADIQQASLVQRAILTPEEVYNSIGDLEIDIRYLPMSGDISGDYYNISEMHDGLASIMIADAAGHGIQAALSTMQIDLLSKESMLVRNPGSRLSYLNKTLTERVSSKNFFTLFLAHIFSDRIAYSSAAHPTQYLIRGSTGEVIPLKTKGKVIGMLPDCLYEMKEIAVAKGDTLYLFTDGIFEEFSPDGVEYGEERLLKFLQSEIAGLSPKEINGKVLKTITDYTAEKHINDDITLICIRIK